MSVKQFVGVIAILSVTLPIGAIFFPVAAEAWINASFQANVPEHIESLWDIFPYMGVYFFLLIGLIALEARGMV